MGTLALRLVENYLGSWIDWGENVMWTKPVIVEVAVGLEINCYACADL